MKKLLALLLISPLVVSEELKLPAKLTCEIASDIYLINLQKDLSTLKVISAFFLSPKKYNTEVKASIKYDDNFLYIKASEGLGLKTIRIRINRLNLAAHTYEPGDSLFSGQCHRGFKTYSEKQI